jgi:hypothetical protein
VIVASFVLNLPIACGDDPPRERPLHQLSETEWRNVVQNTGLALLESKELPARWEASSQGISPSTRHTRLRELIGLAIASEDTIKRQAAAWIRDHCLPWESMPMHREWDATLHQQWIESAIRQDLPFDQFVQCQLAGDLLETTWENRIATATWLRAKNWTADELSEVFASDRQTHTTEPPWPTPIELPSALSRLESKAPSHFVWHFEPSVTERLRDLERAMQSVLQSEQQDWDRLFTGDLVPRWYRQLAGYPMPNEADITWSYPSPSVGEGFAEQDAAWTSFPMPTPLGRVGEWSVVVDLQTPPQKDSDSVGSAGTPQRLLRQRSSDALSDQKHRQWTVEWVEGRIRVSGIHAWPMSTLQVQTTSPIPTSDHHRIAIVYDGLQGANGIRIWVDGAFLPCEILHDSLVKDFLDGGNQTLDVATPSTRGGKPIWIESLECYRIALTEAELAAWDPPGTWQTWEECSVEERQMWTEHYARRLDAQWRYQRESLLFYAGNYAGLWERAPVMPVLAGRYRIASRNRIDSARSPSQPSSLKLGFPETLFSFAGEGRLAIDDWDRKKLALECGDRLAIPLARAEVERQWRSMQRAIGIQATTELSDEARLQFARSFLESRWDRQVLLQALMTSPDWIAIALDSQR